MENRPLEKLVLPVRKSLRWRLPGRFRAGGRTGHDAPPGAAAKHVVSGALQRASGRDIVHQRPPKRLRGVVCRLSDAPLPRSLARSGPRGLYPED